MLVSNFLPLLELALQLGFASRAGLGVPDPTPPVCLCAKWASVYRAPSPSRRTRDASSRPARNRWHSCARPHSDR
uniref:Putative secreted protein n=1 Tax=Anopheles darlingi TaxID=43151 RepID=A0A2M4D413_ANODA